MTLARGTVTAIDDEKRVTVDFGPDDQLVAVPTLYGYDPILRELVAVDRGTSAETSLVLGAIYNA